MKRFSQKFQPFSLLVAIALPPKIIDSTYKWVSDLKSLPQVGARKIESLMTQPILHGGFKLDHGKLLVLNSDASKVLVVPNAGGAPRERPVGDPQEIFWRPPALNNFRLEGQDLHYLDVWAIQLGFKPLGVESSTRGALVGWGTYPAQLFYFPSDLRNFYRIHWGEDSEPLRFFFCDPNTAVLAENLSTGLSRFTFFRSGKPAFYTIFDFSHALRRSDMTAIESSSCSVFYVAGTFGLVRVSYDGR